MSTDETARLRLVEIAERRGQKITARDIATAHMAIAVITQLRELADRNMRAYSDTLACSVDRGVQLQTVREMLGQIREILE
jgi:hypothetical protein